jgi:acyl CoA:acetate/3-ketoacid CoA transferase beta subunit
MKFDEHSRSMYVEAYYADLGVTIGDIRAVTEFDIDVSRAQPTAPPTAEELAVLREKVDPEGIYMRY